ncbi:MAG: sugar ABC transporter ATP-binding protein [Leucobacter sp.]
MEVETAPAPVVRLRGIVKRFAGVAVVDGVDLDLHPGQVHVLAGENGAGKSTLMKVLAGIYRPDGGTIEVAGEECSFDVAGAKARGISIVHQELLIAPNLSVADNLAMGREYRNRFGGLSLKRTREEAKAQLDRVGVSFSSSVRAGTLSTGQQQLVEIARAVAADPKVLIFDEPTAALTTREVRTLFAIIDELRASGCAIVYITHRMDEIEELADVVTVLRDGKFVTTMPKEEATPDAIVTKMVGRSVSSLFPDSERAPGEVRLSVRGLTDGDGIGPIDLDVRAGEIVGVAGLVGSGRSEFARLIFGADRTVEGTVSIDGEPAAAVPSPGSAIRSGIALVPESRKEQGLVLGASVQDNIDLAALGSLTPGLFTSRKRSVELAERYIEQLRIKVASPDIAVESLSGGNQQKVVIAGALATNPRILLLDEPTKGIDIGAKEEILGLIRELARQGLAVLMVSSVIPELLTSCDRILVMRGGRVVGDLDAGEATEESVARLVLAD